MLLNLGELVIGGMGAERRNFKRQSSPMNLLVVTVNARTGARTVVLPDRFQN